MKSPPQPFVQILLVAVVIDWSPVFDYDYEDDDEDDGSRVFSNSRLEAGIRCSTL